MISLSIIVPNTLFFLNDCEVCRPIPVTYLNQTSLFEWRVVRSTCKNGNQNYVFTRD